MMIDQEVERYAAIFDIDSNLDRLVRRLELLAYVNPTNIEHEKKRFFASKYTEEPKFKYSKINFDPYKLQRLFFSQRLERIEDEEIRKLYEDIIYYYSGMVECICTIGKGNRFYYNSLRSYGTPTQRDVENARFILHFPDQALGDDMEKRYTPEDARAYFEEYSKRYDFPLNIKFSNKLSAEAMVSNNQRALIIKRNVKFSDNQLLTLANHEVGVHLVTTYNGLEHPLKIFSNGFPKNVETQEGLAVFSEYMSGALTLKRLKELAYRVLAVDSLLKGYSFADTFDLIHNQYKLDRHEAFTITLRVHRGGGFTKDHLYLTGLKKIYDYYKAGKDLNILLTGKVTIEYKDTIEKLQQIGLANKAKFYADSYENCDNVNPSLDFILTNLK